MHDVPNLPTDPGAVGGGSTAPGEEFLLLGGVLVSWTESGQERDWGTRCRRAQRRWPWPGCFGSGCL